jgi:hypothetical protein
MQVSIRFLAFGTKIPKVYCPLSLPDGATAADLMHIVAQAGASGAFCPASDWPGLSEDVLLASEGNMLRLSDPLRNDQQISIISQIIGG